MGQISPSPIIAVNLPLLTLSPPPWPAASSLPLQLSPPNSFLRPVEVTFLGPVLQHHWNQTMEQRPGSTVIQKQTGCSLSIAL